MPPVAHYVSRSIALVTVTLLLATLSSCTPLQSSRNLTATVVVHGPMRGYIVDQDGRRLGYALNHPERIVETEAGFVNAHPGSDRPPDYFIGLAPARRYTGTFRVVDAAPILLTVYTTKRVEGFLDTSGGFLSQALFFISAPPGATVSLSFKPGQDPKSLRLKVDHDSDGKVDQELAPVGWQDPRERSSPFPLSRAELEELPDGRVRVSLHGAPSRETASPDIQLYYALYPQQPVGQLYEGPFIVDGPSYLLYGAFDADGNLGRLHELDLLGGLAPDLELEIPTDGTAVEVEFTEPGQRAVLRYPARLGDQIEVLFERSTVGVLPDAGLPFGGGVGHAGGTFYFEVRQDGDREVVLDPDWGYTGSVRLRLTNLTEHAPLLEVGGPAVREEFRLRGQKGMFAFEGAAGDRLQLVVTEIEGEHLFATGHPLLTVYKPDGRPLIWMDAITASDQRFNLRLPEDGRYRVEVSPTGNVTGSVELELRAVPE